MKKVVTIQDISCFGKCSLTVALPIISVMGIETAVIPTAVFSTHTGGFKEYTFHNIPYADILDIFDHWRDLKLNFDAIYTGYLKSPSQVQIISKFFDDFRSKKNFIVVDPVLGDFGKIYAGFDDNMINEMRQLCKKADYIIPNFTEASLLLDLKIDSEFQTEVQVKEILKRLTGLGCLIPIITGVRFDNKHHGVVAYNSINDEFFFAFKPHIERNLYGTGDIFASVFTGAITLGKNFKKSINMAIRFVIDCIEATLPNLNDIWYSSCFEICLANLIKYINEN